MSDADTTTPIQVLLPSQRAISKRIFEIGLTVDEIGLLAVMEVMPDNPQATEMFAQFLEDDQVQQSFLSLKEKGILDVEVLEGDLENPKVTFTINLD